MKFSVCKHGGTSAGEAFHNEAVTAALPKQAEQAALAGVEVDVRRFVVEA